MFYQSRRVGVYQAKNQVFLVSTFQTLARVVTPSQTSSTSNSRKDYGPLSSADVTDL